MTDVLPRTADAEAPVNPYSLLEAVNRASERAHNGWLIFLAILAYVTIAVAGVSHTDLLLQTPIALPLMQVDIPLAHFFQFVPVLIVLLHVGLITQLSLLAREALEFDAATRLLETSDRRTHPLRLELNNFFFVQALAGPARSRLMSLFLHGSSWLTLTILPVLLLMYIQVVYLPVHDTAVTWTHRVALLADIAVQATLGMFLTRPETRFTLAFSRAFKAHPLNFLVTALTLSAVAAFSLLFATVPGEPLDRMAQQALGSRGTDQALVTGFAVPIIARGPDGALFGRFQRNLVVTDAGLARRAGDAGLVLRDRDLRYARLDRSVLPGADLTGSDLAGASFVGADLNGARLGCADPTAYVQTGDRDKGRCVRAERSDFTRAALEGADFSGIDLNVARLVEAKAAGADFTGASLAGADMTSADLRTAGLAAQAPGAVFHSASMQGADLRGAQLMFADLSSAALNGAVLDQARLHAASLRDADLEAASFAGAKLAATDLTGAKLAATNFEAVSVWASPPPLADASRLSDARGVQIAALDETELEAVKRALAAVTATEVSKRGTDALAPLFDEQTSSGWQATPAAEAWRQGLIAGTATAAPEASAAAGSVADPAAAVAGAADRAALTARLVRIMCSQRGADGAIATGIALRAARDGFKGDAAAIHDSLKSDSCPASKTVRPEALRALAAAAERQRGP